MDERDCIPMKVCKDCLQEHSIGSFHKKKRGKHGVQARCKLCQAAYNKKWITPIAQMNASQFEAYRKRSAKQVDRRTGASRRESRQKFYQENRARLIQSCLDYAKKNPENYAARAMHRLTLKRQATPVWSEIKKIKGLYEKAARLSEATNEKWHVDHIVPLNSLLVCGLHVFANLSVITAAENIAKSNSYWPDMP